MSEQVAIERVAKAIHETGIQVVATERTPWPMRSVTAAAIQEYNAYLRERSKDDDVVEAAAMPLAAAFEEGLRCGANDYSGEVYGRDFANATLTAALDAMIGKENHDAD